MLKPLRFILVNLICFYSIGIGIAQTPQDTLKVLFVGNSYTSISNMPHLVSLISERTNLKIITSKSTVGGADLSDHWHSRKGLTTKQEIRSGNYDVVVIQGHSMETINQKEDFLKYSKKLVDLVKGNGAKPYLYVTWARQKVPQYQSSITAAYEEAATLNDCELIRVGDAWKLARTLRPEIPLFHPDGSHQSDLGAFLTALVFVGNLSGDIPENLKTHYFVRDANGKEVMLLWEDALDITFCQKVAVEFINK